MTSVQSDVVVREVRIAARPETIFGFLTDPDLMARWMGQNVQLEPRAGGIYRVDINGEAIARGEFIEVVPNQRVSISFGWEGENHPVPPGSSVVEITLTPRAIPPSSGSNTPASPRTCVRTMGTAGRATSIAS